MKKKIISDAITNISSEYIEKAADYTVAKKSRKPVWVRWGAMAACLCLVVVAAIPIINHFNQPYVDEGNNPLPPISADGKYTIEHFTVTDEADTVNLFVRSITPPAEICDTVNQRYPNVDVADAIFVFSYSEDVAENYWFPVIEDGKITDIVFATFNSEGEVLTGHSESHAAELNTISEFTDESKPLYIVAEEYGNYYVIGDTAYVTNDALGKENERIREFIIPAEDLVTVEIP